jgi:biopolymer transport protein ExbD
MDLEQQIDDEDIEVDMSPMIDMVFLLLIFFIVASIITVDKVDVDIPSAVYAKVTEDVTGRYMISINKKEELFAGLGENKVTIDELKDILAKELEMDPGLRLIIRSDGDVKYKINEEVMTACGEVGATNLAYAAFEQ